MAKQYYGPHEVLSVEERDDVVRLTLTTGENDVQGEHTYQKDVPTILFDSVVTPEQMNWNFVQDQRMKMVSKDFLEIAIKYHLTGGELKPLLQRFHMDFLTVIDRAINYQFLGDDKRFVPGGDVYYEFTANRAHEITKHLDDDEPSNSN